MIEIGVSVRDLVAFCHRSGHIDHRFTPSPSAEQGIEGHQRVFRRRPGSYQREYPVQWVHQQGDVTLRVRGRADGFDAAQGLLEEIKTCRIDAEEIPPPVTAQHLAQARVYAAIICAERELPSLTVRLNWLNIDSDQEVWVEETCSADSLSAFLEDTLQRFSAWLAVLARLRRRRDASLENLPFPHGSFRPGQREIAELVYRCIDRGGELMIEAPTGIGKTAAVLYPALKALGTGKHEGIVFTTARTVGRRAAENCLDQLRAVGLDATALSLTAKDKICFSPGHACHWDDCPFARGYYDRLPAALEEAIRQPSLRREDIEMVARRHEVCPYQLADDLLPWVDIAVVDVHYLYSLYPRLGHLIAQDARRFSVLVDEAHNLPDRARDMYSARLAKRDLMAVRRRAPAALRKPLERVNRALLALQKEPWAEAGLDTRDVLPETLLHRLADFCAAVGDVLAAQPDFLSSNPGLMDFYFDLLHWLRVAEYWGDEFLLELHRGEGAQGLVLQISCLDPSRLLRDANARLHAVVVFSATLSPLPWMRERLGLADEAVCRQMPSPFIREQLAVQLATDIDTRYQARQRSLGQLVATLADWLAAQPGNCLVYFPSYRYLQDCLAELKVENRTLWQQRPGLSEDERGALLDLFAGRRDVVAFCILGGVFGEGIDLPGDQLSGVVVVGVGMPQVGREREQLRTWYQQTRGRGFEYAYMYPGMQKVAQALGRVVRTDSDRGRALLVDPRYARPEYRALLPPWWDYED
jgi:DNA excision repair protein ERCC-2